LDLGTTRIHVREDAGPESEDDGKGYGTSTVICPAWMNVITPAQMHINWETLSRVGKFPRRTVGAPGIQGAGVFGMHGIGVSTPNAAAVAAATIGFAMDIHMPKGMIFVIGM